MIQDDKNEEWEVQGTVIGYWEQMGLENVLQADIRLLYFVRERDGKQLFSELHDMPDRFGRHAVARIENAAKDAFEDVVQPRPIPSDLGIKE